MLRHDTIPALARAAAIGVAVLLIVGAPTTGHAHGSSRFSDFFWGHDGDRHDGNRDRGRWNDWNHGHDDDGNHGRDDDKCCKVSQCDDGNVCTADSCRDGKCTHSPMAGCQVCSCDADCAGANACSRGDCDHGVCRQIPIAGCTACTTNAGCNDGNPCTTDSCQAASCKTTPIAGCVACNSCGDCDDHNPCTDDQCGTDGVCHPAPIAGCVQCTVATECDDQNLQTTDACTAGLCVHRPVALPPAEVCDDATDNDGNGLTDCADPACADFAACAPPKEICGDCIDNDGDGLVDYEDSDCCARPMALTLEKVIVRPAAKKHQDRLKIRSIYTKAMPANFDPLKQDTTLQIADENGQLFCTTIKASHFMPRGQHSMAFWSDGSYTNGLSDGRFTIKRNGKVKFRTHGHNAQIRPTTSTAIRFTLRVGDHCSQVSMTPRAKKTVLLIP